MTEEIIIKVAKPITYNTPEELQEKTEQWKKAMVLVADIFPPDTLLEFMEDLTANHPKVVDKIRKGQRPSQAMLNSMFGGVFNFSKNKNDTTS